MMDLRDIFAQVECEKSRGRWPPARISGRTDYFMYWTTITKPLSGRMETAKTRKTVLTRIFLIEYPNHRQEEGRQVINLLGALFDYRLIKERKNW